MNQSSSRLVPVKFYLGAKLLSHEMVTTSY
jgi:hypothetical protein